jgi:hypothetical protein
MTRKYWLGLVPSLIVAAGIIVATLVAVRAGLSGWLVMAGPVLLALSVVGASALDSWLRGASLAPSWAALILAGSCVLAALLVGSRDPGLVKTLMPILGVSGWIALPSRSESQRNPCTAV